MNVTFAMLRLLMGWIGCLSFAVATAEQLIPLRSGINLRGNVIELATLDQNAFSAGADGGIQIRPIWMVDDGLRRTHIHRRGMVSAEPVQVPDLGQRIEFFQPVADGGDEVSSIGQILTVSSLDDYGRRRVTVRGPEGEPFVMHQGLTELTARYARMESLVTDRPVSLDMRVATSTIDTPSLLRVFRRRMDQTDIFQRLEVVRFLIEAERFSDAHSELRRIVRDFPQRAELKTQLTALVEQQAMQLLDQAELRRQSGQPKLASAILQKFPVDQVSQVTRLRVTDALASIQSVDDQSGQAIASLRELVGKLKPEESGPLGPLLVEIQANLSDATLPRLSDFNRLGAVEEQSPANRVALAVAGWILGSGSGQQNLKVATSLIEVRNLVAEVLRTGDVNQRSLLIERLSRLEGARAENITKMLPLMRPPLDQTPLDLPLSEDPVPPRDAIVDESVAGLMTVHLDQASSFLVQLPPEYDPLRSYPCVVALHAAGAQPETQLNWWCGVPTNRFLSHKSDEEAKGQADDAVENVPIVKAMRLGHAARHGFIVVAPNWTRPGQRAYEYTAREHAAVLRMLRGALRRFSIDADRVFIGGHGAGGTAAWDIAVSHPDLWAGLISINADPEKTLHHYNQNAVYVPTYIVMGDKDDRPLKRYGAIYDDYMSYQHDAMVVLYRGQGREFFHEESDRIFEWMKSPSHVRRPAPEKIEAKSMRAGDQFFWWLEWQEMLPAVAIDPILWDEAPRTVAADVITSIGAKNEVRISQAPAKAFTVWLGPHLPLNFGDRISVVYHSRRVDFEFDGSLTTLLEDVHGRADRTRVHWGKVQVP